jgi:hypothetical protein
MAWNDIDQKCLQRRPKSNLLNVKSCKQFAFLVGKNCVNLFAKKNWRRIQLEIAAVVSAVAADGLPGGIF